MGKGENGENPGRYPGDITMYSTMME